VATEFTKLVYKEKKILWSVTPEGTKPKYMIFFSSEPHKMTNKQNKEKKLTFLNHLLAPTFLAQNPENKK
jgi:hypothetical protein